MPLLLVAAAFQIFDALGIVSDGALRGAGDTLWPFVVRFFLAWGIQVPLAYTLGITLGGGLTGAWIGSMVLHRGLVFHPGRSVPIRTLEVDPDLGSLASGRSLGRHFDVGDDGQVVRRPASRLGVMRVDLEQLRVIGVDAVERKNRPSRRKRGRPVSVVVSLEFFVQGARRLASPPGIHVSEQHGRARVKLRMREKRFNLSLPCAID